MFFVLLFSCRKDNIPLPHYYWGKVNAEKNGKNWASEQKNWTLTIYGVIEYRGARMKKDSFALLIDKFNESNAMRERIGISGIPVKIGTYKVYNTTEAPNFDRDSLTMAGSYLFEQDGDVISEIYDVLETAKNTVSVDALDTVRSEVRGKFNITFINKYPKPGLPPDTIRFKNGVYHTKIHKTL